MPYFLDGNNLIGRARGSSRPSEEDRASLIAELAERLRRTRAKALLFFDGPGSRRTSLGSLSIQESGPGGADDAILREVGRSRAPGEILVVTADRALAQKARDQGAGTLDPDEFWSRFGVSRRSGAPEEPGKVDVQDWVKYFEDESNREG